MAEDINSLILEVGTDLRNTDGDLTTIGKAMENLARHTDKASNSIRRLTGDTEKMKTLSTSFEALSSSLTIFKELPQN